MTERHEFQFAGCWLPREVVCLLRDKELSGTDLLIYTMVAALQGAEGCYASNAYLANSVGIGERAVQKALVRLRVLGLVQTIKFDGRRRWLQTTWQQHAEVPSQGVAAAHQQGTHNNKQLNKPSTVQGTVGDGFGLGQEAKTVATPPTEQDVELATKLLQAVRAHLGAGHLLVKRGNPKAWATHFERLRRLDGLSHKEIEGTLEWYVANIGGDYVPGAYSGEGFRKKFAGIQAAMGRAGDALPTEVCDAAKALVEKLKPMGWPKGSAGRLPLAVQNSLTTYRTWRVKAVQWLNAQPTGFAKAVAQALPQPEAYMEQWFREAHNRVVGWAAWDGKFNGMEWRPNHDRFRAWGWQFATQYTGDRDRWDSLMQNMLEALRYEG